MNFAVPQSGNQNFYPRHQGDQIVNSHQQRNQNFIPQQQGNLNFIPQQQMNETFIPQQHGTQNFILPQQWNHIPQQPVNQIMPNSGLNWASHQSRNNTLTPQSMANLPSKRGRNLVDNYISVNKRNDRETF